MYCNDCSRPVEYCVCGAFSSRKDSPEESRLREFFTCNKLPPAGDRGQRYEVRFTEDGAEKVLGWSESYPQGYVDAINVHPVWHSPRVIDRKSEPRDG